MSGYIPGLIYGLSLNQSTLPTGGGLQLGQIILYNLPNGGFAELMLVQASGTVAANDAVTFSSALFVVVSTSAVTQTVDGVNDVSNGTIGTGASISSGNYFLATVRGICKPKVAAGVAQNVALICTVTSGTLGAWANTSPQSGCKTLTASGAGGATNCRLY